MKEISTGCEVLEERAGYGGGEVEVEGVIKRSGGVGHDALHVMRCRLEEVDGGDVVDGIPILIDEEIERDSVLPQILDVDQRREYILAESVVDQDLVDLLVRRSADGAHSLVQIQHLNDALCQIQQMRLSKLNSEIVAEMERSEYLPVCFCRRFSAISAE